MQIKFKTAANDVFTMELDESQSVKDVKQKIRTERGAEYDIERQTLIYGGKILKDEDTVADLQLDEKRFIAILLVKPKVAQPAAEPVKIEEPEVAQMAQIVELPDTVTEVKAEIAAEPEQLVASAPTVIPQESEEDQLAEYLQQGLLQVDESVMRDLISMGFEEANVRRALQLSFNNAERAVDFLTNGFPYDAFSVAAELARTQQPMRTTGQQGDDTGPVSTLQQLVNKPGFVRLRRAVQQNPDMLQELLAEMERTNPEWITIINENQQAFVDLLNEEEDYGASDMPADELQTGGGGEQPTAPRTQSNPTDDVIQLHPQDLDAIERLRALGFSGQACVEAYIACERNENMAANYLLQTMEDEESQPPPPQNRSPP